LKGRNRELSRLATIVGGFLILAGTVLLGIAILAVSGFMTSNALLEPKYLLTFALAIFTIGILDFFSAIVLARW
jgi:putative flippase GtrA